MTKYLAIAVLLLAPACKKKDGDAKKGSGAAEGTAAAKEGGTGGGKGGGGGKGTGGGGGKGNGGGDGGACGALAITVDGQPLEGMNFGQGVTWINGEFTIQMVNLYNHDVPCEDALGNHAPSEGEIFAKAWVSAMPGVGIDAYTEVPMHPKIDLTKDTKVVGEPFEVCVREPIEFTPNAGAYSGKKVTMAGSFQGKWCGEVKQ